MLPKRSKCCDILHCKSAVRMGDPARNGFVKAGGTKMPRNKHGSISDSDDRVRLPAHIVILMVVVLLFFVGVGAVLIYSSINSTATPKTTPSPQVQVTPSATTQSSPTAHPTPTSHPSPAVRTSPTNSSVPNPYPPHTGRLALNDPLK